VPAPPTFAPGRLFVHLDEYEISLARELRLCSEYVRKCRLLLERMETRHGMTTEVFLSRQEQGALAVSRDFTKWRDGAEGLRRWSDARNEYARLLGIMKI
jgi:hypothetical protein